MENKNKSVERKAFVISKHTTVSDHFLSNNHKRFQLLTCYLFLSNSLNLIVTVYAKLERYTPSLEVNILEPLA